MSPTLTEILAAAAALSAAERRELVELLLDKLDDAGEEEVTPTLSAAWQQEVARRSADYDAGRAETIAWQEVQARWEARRATDG